MAKYLWSWDRPIPSGQRARNLPIYLVEVILNAREEIVAVSRHTWSSPVSLDNGVVARVEFKDDQVADIGVHFMGNIFMRSLLGTNFDCVCSRG
jgi:hypothetical protein